MYIWGQMEQCMEKAIVVVVVSQFNGTSTPKGSYSAKTGYNDCNVDLIRYSLSTALCESNSLSGQVRTKCPTRPDTQGAPRGGCSHAPLKGYDHNPSFPNTHDQNSRFYQTTPLPIVSSVLGFCYISLRPFRYKTFSYRMGSNPS